MRMRWSCSQGRRAAGARARPEGRWPPRRTTFRRCTCPALADCAAQVLRVGRGCAAEGRRQAARRRRRAQGARAHAICAAVRPRAALDTLEPALRRTPRRSRAPAPAGEARLATGNVAKGGEFYERANRDRPGNASGRVRLAQIRLASGDTARDLAISRRCRSSTKIPSRTSRCHRAPAQARVRQGARRGCGDREEATGQRDHGAARQRLSREARSQGSAQAFAKALEANRPRCPRASALR